MVDLDDVAPQLVAVVATSASGLRPSDAHFSLPVPSTPGRLSHTIIGATGKALW
jgi:hypothetical protein